MSPLKFEEKMKEKLEQRSIKPSKDSWERLASKLDDSQSQKTESKKILWYSVAAIFVGVLVVTSIFRSNTVVSGDRNTQFVDVNNEDVKEDDKRKIEKENNNQIVTKDEIDIDYKTKIDKIVKPSSVNNTVVLKDEDANVQISNTKKSNTDNIVMTENNIDLTNVKEQEIELSNTSKLVEDKVAEVVAQIQELKNNNVEVTDNEINTLLLEAQREIATKKILKSNTVSASALLQDVEDEIDETFKQRVFEALKTGFQKVKTAVAEREN